MTKKPTILLIYPYWLEQRTHTEDVVSVPIGLYALGAALMEAGWDAHVLNWHDMQGREAEVEAELKRLRPDVIGFSVLMANRVGALELADIAKRVLPHVPVVFGGVGATTLWEYFLSHFPQVDCCVLGEGDRTMPLLADALLSDEKDLSAIPGVAYRDGHTPRSNAQPDHVRDLDDLPIPAKYYTYQHLSLTRGCPGRCTFCGSPDFWGPKVRFRSPGHFVDEVEMLVNKGVTFLYVSDDTFTLDRKRVIAVCREIIDRGISVEWNAISRVNHVDAEMLRWMRLAGCIQISYGVESGDEGIRDYLNKNIDEGDVRQAFALTTAHGILARAYFIYGCPGESDETIDRTLALIQDIRPLVVHFFILSIFPGTALYADYKERTGTLDDIWLHDIEDIKHFETDPDMSLEQVAAFGQRLRDGYHAMLPDFARSITLVEDDELAPHHADFLARLGMTFHSGDYAMNPDVEDASGIAQSLYRRALEYGPDATAALGLGMLLQKNRDYAESIPVLALGVQHHPRHEKLNFCLALSLMNLGEFEKALSFLMPFEQSPQAMQYAAICFRNLGDTQMEAEVTQKFQALQGQAPQC